MAALYYLVIEKTKSSTEQKTKQSMNMNILNFSSVIREFVPSDFVKQISFYKTISNVF